VRDNIRASGGEGVVIATEYEPQKARAARAHFEQAGLSRYIDLREGDLRETLRQIDGPVDFMLMDIWISMARPALELVSPHLASGAIVIADNTASHPEAYAAYSAFLRDPANQFRTMTLPFEGGQEMSVRCA
jgi:predicted O-methyltransferase YrrM